jgi:ATP-dependent protease ClpP protease subunit
MVTVYFDIAEDFEQPLADRFVTFLNGLTEPCAVQINIESCGGLVDVLVEMEQAISLKKSEGYLFTTNVETYAYSCGMFLFLLGDIRLCADNANFLYHSAGFNVGFERLTSTDLKEMLDIIAVGDELTNKILSENTTVEPGMLEILKKNDNFLSKEDLIFLGFMEREYELI